MSDSLQCNTLHCLMVLSCNVLHDIPDSHPNLSQTEKIHLDCVQNYGSKMFLWYSHQLRVAFRLPSGILFQSTSYNWQKKNKLCSLLKPGRLKKYGIEPFQYLLFTLYRFFFSNKIPWNQTFFTSAEVPYSPPIWFTKNIKSKLVF